MIGNYNPQKIVAMVWKHLRLDNEMFMKLNKMKYMKLKISLL